MRAHPLSVSVRIAALVLILLAAGAGVLLFAAAPVAAVSYVQGPIVTDTIWGPPETTYVAIKDVTVRAPATLTIMPGTTVKFDPGVHLFIDGGLVADGTSGSPITFTANNTASVFPWIGIQFNATATGSVSWATLDRVDRAITVQGSSPTISSNTVLQAGAGFVFFGSSSLLWGNTVRRASSIGVYINASDVQVINNMINGTAIGIDVEQPGSPVIFANTITNVSSAFAVGILITAGASADVNGNVIRGVQGVRGPNGIAAGAAGRDGAIALGIYVSGAPAASVTANTIDVVVGGRGGDGQANAGGTGGRGGNGGAGAGIAVASTPGVFLQGNTVTNVAGGRGGAGGSGATTASGGRGGNAGIAVGIEIVSATGFGQAYTNTVDGLLGGVGGFGGDAVSDGDGGVGGDVYGLFLIQVANADASGNTLRTLRGGLGGNSTATGVGTGNAASGGAVVGAAVFSVVGSATVHANDGTDLRGGDGGRGTIGGQGGNATGILAFGNDDATFNVTRVSFNRVQSVTGGQGGIGAKIGGDGGSTTGVAVILASPDLAWNTILTMQGGRGGDAIDNSDGGRGGDAAGIAGGLVANGRSSGDSISGVTKGGVGAGPPAQVSYADGYYLLGNATFTTRFTVANGTFASVGSYEFYVENGTEAVAINTPFTTLAVQPAGTLTVMNYLEVEASWPNGATPVAGARILVEDNGSPVWDQVAATGVQSWILVTDRVYINSNTAADNRTRVTVTYLSYTFLSSPRDVDMGTSHTESFVMVDNDAPTSAAGPLPTYENARTFLVAYTATDGNGTGLGNITLWYRSGGGWTPFATQPAGNGGSFSFTAASDGVYEFATTADDLSGNQQPGPSANDTWTIVDTVRPGSHVDPLPTYETTTPFLVSWAPDAGVTDIVSYTVQYNAGSG